MAKTQKPATKTAHPVTISSRGPVAARAWQPPDPPRALNLLLVTRGPRILAEIVLQASRAADLELIEELIVAAINTHWDR